MFNEVHKLDNSGIELVFVKSANVQAFPCGRRRSILIDADDNNLTVSDQYRMPFDPEARLNTEANNRKHSGLNGYTQSYVSKWDEGVKQTSGTSAVDGALELVLGGYIFNIKLDDDAYKQPADFGANIIRTIKNANDAFDTSANKIYANIRLEEARLFSGENFVQYNTEVLRNQSGDTSDSLDLLSQTAGSDFANTKNPDYYYFSGLSFSTEPLTGDNATRSVKDIPAEAQNPAQRVFSLCILAKIDSSWKVYQPAYLPKIEHGDIENSVKLGTVVADKLSQDGKPVVTLELEDMGNNTHLLKLFYK